MHANLFQRRSQQELTLVGLAPGTRGAYAQRVPHSSVFSVHQQPKSGITAFGSLGSYQEPLSHQNAREAFRALTAASLQNDMKTGCKKHQHLLDGTSQQHCPKRKTKITKEVIQLFLVSHFLFLG